MATERSHLTEKERYQIEALAREGFGVRAIGLARNRSPSVISRELKRNTPAQGTYTAEVAQAV